MKSIRMKLLLFIFTVLALGLWFAPANAQGTVNVTINFTEYDVIFLTDFVNVKTQKLSSSVSGMSVDLESNSAEPVEISIDVNVQVQLRGDKSPTTLVWGSTKPFKIIGRQTLSARDFAKDGSGIARLTAEPNTTLMDRIINLAQTTSTAPPGIYQVTMRVIPTDSKIQGDKDSKTINVAYATPDEVFVEINEPKTGSCFNYLTPTFNWTSAEPSVTVRVFEAGVSHRSPQDALTGSNPYLEEKPPVGANTLTYPANAARQLQENKAYVLQIEANISSSRGPMKSISQPVVFRITNDNLGNILDNFLNSISGNASATYSTLRAEPTKWIPWSPYGNITLNGTMLSESDLQVLLNELSTQQDVKLELSVENQ